MKQRLKTIFVYVLGLVIGFGMGYSYFTPSSPIDVEYEVELVNEDTVRVYSPSTQRIYTCPGDSIQAVLIYDNL